MRQAGPVVQILLSTLGKTWGATTHGAGLRRRRALLGARLCIGVSGVIFAGLHFLYGNPSPENLLGGFILTWANLKSGTLIVPISLHAVGNLCAFFGNIGYLYWWHGSGM
jgi:membrane protease YdiL (CAAX protease family)